MDNYEMNNGEKIYPIFQIELDGKKYLFYSDKNENISNDDIYVGEEIDNDLLPVSEETLPQLEEKFQSIIENLE